jgi:hypothetical protein
MSVIMSTICSLGGIAAGITIFVTTVMQKQLFQHCDELVRRRICVCCVHACLVKPCCQQPGKPRLLSNQAFVSLLYAYVRPCTLVCSWVVVLSRRNPSLPNKFPTYLGSQPDYLHIRSIPTDSLAADWRDGIRAVCGQQRAAQQFLGPRHRRHIEAAQVPQSSLLSVLHGERYHNYRVLTCGLLKYPAGCGVFV